MVIAISLFASCGKMKKENKKVTTEQSVDISFLDTINDAIQEKPLTAFTDYQEELDMLKKYATSLYCKIIGLCVSDKQKKVLAEEMKQWEVCTGHLCKLNTCILEANFGAGTMSIPLSHIYASYVYSMRAEMSAKELALFEGNKIDEVESDNDFELEKELKSFNDFFYSFYHKIENKKNDEGYDYKAKCKEAKINLDLLIENVKVWYQHRNGIASLFFDKYKQKGYKDISTLYIVTIFRQLIPQICNENGCAK